MLRFVHSLRFCAAAFPMLFGWNFGVSPMPKNVSVDLSKVWVFDSSEWFTLTDDETDIVSYNGPRGTETEPVDIKVPSGVTNLPAGLFDDTYINVLSIPSSVETVNPYAFYRIKDTMTLKVEGNFSFFWKEIFPAIIRSYQLTIDEGNSSASVPTTIIVDGVTYRTNKNNFSVYGNGYVYYYTNGNEKRYTRNANRAAFYYNGLSCRKNIN